MDNSMGQMGQMAPLGLSQSMDSVNTASNEEEVGHQLFSLYMYVIINVEWANQSA